RSSWPICAIAGNPLPSTRHCCTWIRFSTAKLKCPVSAM
ncbi:IS30 family transposase, partial [Sinorhizobium meliloti]